MDIMNLINEICLLYVQIANTNKHQFLKRFKYKKEIKSMKNKLYRKNIFRFSDAFVTFVTGLPDDLKELCYLNGVKVGSSYIVFKINNKYIDYSASNRKFVVTDYDENLVYTVYKNTKISKNTQNKWNKIMDSIYNKYINIISIVANEFEPIIQKKEKISFKIMDC